MREYGHVIAIVWMVAGALLFGSLTGWRNTQDPWSSRLYDNMEGIGDAR